LLHPNRPLDGGTVELEDNAGSIDVMDDEIPLDGVTAPLDCIIIGLVDDVGSNDVVDDAAPVDDVKGLDDIFDSLRITKIVTTAAAAATAPTIIPITSISSERFSLPNTGVAGGCSSRRGGRGSSIGGAEHVVSDGNGLSLLQQLRWL
jgi:hypothetical protein